MLKIAFFGVIAAALLYGTVFIASAAWHDGGREPSVMAALLAYVTTTPAASNPQADFKPMRKFARVNGQLVEVM